MRGSPIINALVGAFWVFLGLLWIGMAAGFSGVLAIIGVLIMLIGFYLIASGAIAFVRVLRPKEQKPEKEEQRCDGGYCQYCGSPVGRDYAHCRVCGRKLE